MLHRAGLLLVFIVSATSLEGSEYNLPKRVKVLPVAFVSAGEKAPTDDEQKLFLRHIQWSRDRYREMLDGDTFELAKPTVTIVKGQKPLDFYRTPPERGAPDIVSELLTHIEETRFSCPYVFCILLMNSKDSFPEGGGRSINGGINTGGGMMYIASWELTHNTHFQTTLQHELGHAFGLAHVDVYGYDMKTNASIMSYNQAHHCRGMEPSKTPGNLIPEDRRALALNDRVFAKTTFDPQRDVPKDYSLSKRIVPLGSMTLPGQPDFYPQIKTTAGEDVFSKVTNIVKEEIKPSSGPGITYDASTMWHSKPLPDGKATLDITFPFPVTLTGISIHSQHSGIHHEATAAKIEATDGGSRKLIIDRPIKLIDETVNFPAATSANWSLTLTAGKSGILIIRGLQFFNEGQEICPHMVPDPTLIAMVPLAGVEAAKVDEAITRGKKTAPDGPTLESARKSVKDQFKAEIAKAKKPDAKSGLARTLIEQAASQPDDDAQFAYLAEAIAFAGQGGDLELALQAIKQLTETFDTPTSTWTERAASAISATPLTLDHAQVESLFGRFIGLSDEAAANDDCIAALSILKSAADLVRKPAFKPLKDDATFLIKQMTAHKEAFDAAKNSRDKLATNADDPSANLAWGRFVCFYKQDWDQGLKLLAKANDKIWAPLANREITPPMTAADWLQLGDDWQQAGIREKDTIKVSTLDRADRAWQQAVATATAPQKKEIEQKVDQRLIKLFGTSFATTKGDAAGIAIPGSDRFSPTENFTIEFWVSTQSPKGTLLSKKHSGEESSVIVHLDNGVPNLSVAVGGGEGGSGGDAPVNDGQWHHMAVVKQADEVTLFVDGSEATRTTLKGPLQSRSPWKFGTSYNRVACAPRFGGLRISKSARYSDAFTPKHVHAKDKDTLLPQ